MVQSCLNELSLGLITSKLASSSSTPQALFSQRVHSAGHIVRQTSLDAYSDLCGVASYSSSVLGERQELVYLAFKKLCSEQGDATDMEVTAYLFRSGQIKRFDRNLVSPRRDELVKLGLIYEYGKRSCNITAKSVISWNVKSLR